MTQAQHALAWHENHEREQHGGCPTAWCARIRRRRRPAATPLEGTEHRSGGRQQQLGDRGGRRHEHQVRVAGQGKMQLESLHAKLYR
jgi:hypothetical protein